jgi:hypothetical protein
MLEQQEDSIKYLNQTVRTFTRNDTTALVKIMTIWGSKFRSLAFPELWVTENEFYCSPDSNLSIMLNNNKNRTGLNVTNPMRIFLNVTRKFEFLQPYFKTTELFFQLREGGGICHLRQRLGLKQPQLSFI